MTRANGTLQWSRKCYGIDFQDDTHVVVCGDKGRGGKIFSQVSLKDEPVINDLKKGVPCAVSLSARESVICRVNAPFGSLAKAEKVFPTLLDIHLPFPLEDCAYEFVGNKREGSGITALAVVGRKKDIEAKLTCLCESGIDPHVLDHEGLALWTQALQEFPVSEENESAWRAVINLNGKNSSMAIGRGVELLNFHSISGDDSGQINRLMKACAASFKGSAGCMQDRIQWIWTGPGCYPQAKVSGLCSALDYHVSGAHIFADEPWLFLARAISARALFPGPLKCNLRKGGIVVHGGELARSRRRFISSVVVLAISGSVLCLANAFIQGLVNKKEKEIDRNFYAVANEAAGYDISGLRGEHVVREARSQVERKKQMYSLFMELSQTSMLDLLAAVMAISKKSDYTLDAVQFDREEIMISGTAPGLDSFDDLLKYLKQQGYKLSEDNIEMKESLENERVPFRIMSGKTK